jgi:hypothetical protein
VKVDLPRSVVLTLSVKNLAARRAAVVCPRGAANTSDRQKHKNPEKIRAFHKKALSCFEFLMGFWEPKTRPLISPAQKQASCYAILPA